MVAAFARCGVLVNSELACSSLMDACDGRPGGEVLLRGAGLADGLSDHFLAGLVSGDRPGYGGLGGAVMLRFGENAGRRKKQDCKRQKGRYGGVQTHLDFGGAERQSTFYVKD
jgi:hypothetical protein